VIIGGISEGYVVVCQSEYVGLKRKILVQRRERGMESRMEYARPESRPVIM
jgi:hypothetical protein